MAKTIRTLAPILLLALAACGGSSSSGSDSSSPTTIAYGANLDGAQEVPPVATAATGTATIQHDPAADTMDITITISGLSVADVTAFHIHEAPTGANGGVIVDLGAAMTFMDIGGGQIQAMATGVAFPDASEGVLAAGNCYINVHTMANPPGEVRGQIAATP